LVLFLLSLGLLVVWPRQSTTRTASTGGFLPEPVPVLKQSSPPSEMHSTSTSADTSPTTPIRQISILGERNSGTRWTFE
jgi:hypothetical protein